MNLIEFDSVCECDYGRDCERSLNVNVNVNPTMLLRL